MNKVKRRPKEASKQIIERIRKGPVFKSEIIKELNISRKTVEYNFKEFLPDLGLTKTLPDGRFAWIDYNDKEDKIKKAYEKLKRMFFGEPPLNAVSLEVKETLKQTRKLLNKYTDYKEPAEEELMKSAKEIQRYLLWKCWVDQKLHMYNFKKWGLENGVDELSCFGLDRDSFSNLINKQGMPSVDEVSSYLETFPELKIEVKWQKNQRTAYYGFTWSEYAKNTFKVLGGKLKPWEEKGKVPLPRRMDISKYNLYKESIDSDPTYVLDRIEDLAKDSVPSEEALEDCLIWLRNPDFKNRGRVFAILHSFFKNAKECEFISHEKEEAVMETLANIAFDEEVERTLRWKALEIIRIYDSEKVNDKAKAFCLKAAKKDCDSEDYLFDIARWICRDPKIKGEIIEEVERIILESGDQKIKNCAETLLKYI